MHYLFKIPSRLLRVGRRFTQCRSRIVCIIVVFNREIGTLWSLQLLQCTRRFQFWPHEMWSKCQQSSNKMMIVSGIQMNGIFSMCACNFALLRYSAMASNFHECSLLFRQPSIRNVCAYLKWIVLSAFRMVLYTQVYIAQGAAIDVRSDNSLDLIA